jgi:hypothetical protein
LASGFILLELAEKPEEQHQPIGLLTSAVGVKIMRDRRVQ